MTQPTDWAALDADGSAFVRLARDNFLWTTLDFAVALAPLTRTALTWVSPRYSSRTCSGCGHRNAWPPLGGQFVCEACRLRLPSDVNAARNIRRA